MAEWRHRYNQHVSEHRRFGFPKIGHSDTWLIDSLQLLVERNHGVLIFPDWSNTNDYISTLEHFGTVALHSVELAEAIKAIELPPAPADQPHQLTADQRYLCKTMDTKLPLLPVVETAEFKLFEELVASLPTPLDFDRMAIKWCERVDGINIFPKLPVYLRTHYTTWQRNQRVRDAVRRAAAGEIRLRELNARLGPVLPPAPAAPAAAPATPAAPAAAPNGAPNTAPTGAPTAHATAAAAAAAPAPKARINQPRMPPTMPQPPLTMPLPVEVAVVGGHAVGGAPPTQPMAPRPAKRRNGQRGEDTGGKRATRRCKRCLMHNESEADAATCKGRAPKGTCQKEHGCTVCGKEADEPCKCAVPKYHR
jgi:hypothetical protein